ncbi:hypothetical protein QTP70_016492 [Hemibagrus guttatus]|uniref:Retrotransposon gag domain-containing protein n=1 Tax=Hemibagrus guttatus TaxID=175788 RepID=A0AAE0QA14_9TELE|nr:hypothetical protein QTP70_016492 [Hemibagrus guttatus]KAK3542111.1 hypothetical protein QTP86_015096 [Hemibagrus guttatus]
MDPASSGAGGAPSQNTSPPTDPAELREIIVRQDSLIRAFQAQLEALTVQLSNATAAAPRETPIARGKALDWASAVWDADPLIRASYSHFEEGIREVFEHSAGGKDILVQLMEILQGSESAADYAIRFRTLAVQSEWNDAVLWAVFHAGLNPALQTELACHVEATSLSQFVATAIRLDNLWRQRRTGASDMASARPHVRMDCPGRGERDPEPMQLGRSRLTEEECRPRGPPRRCYNCGSTGHLSPTFEKVFSEERASRLPEHQEWDCAINLLPNTSLPKGRIYPLLLPESEAMEDHIEGALAAGHIRSSTSPAAAGFFFVEKKDGGLRPCIDYRGLNSITVRYPYPLPLVPAALEQLHGTRVFTKLDIRSAYNLVCIQEGLSGTH